MYIPSHFQIEDEKIAQEIIKEHSFATLFDEQELMDSLQEMVLKYEATDSLSNKSKPKKITFCY
jgi:predicted FMN-binding regulatory protein PaiB